MDLVTTPLPVEGKINLLYSHNGLHRTVTTPLPVEGKINGERVAALKREESRPLYR